MDEMSSNVDPGSENEKGPASRTERVPSQRGRVGYARCVCARSLNRTKINVYHQTADKAEGKPTQKDTSARKRAHCTLLARSDPVESISVPTPLHPASPRPIDFIELFPTKRRKRTKATGACGCEIQERAGMQIVKHDFDPIVGSHPADGPLTHLMSHFFFFLELV